MVTDSGDPVVAPPMWILPPVEVSKVAEDTVSAIGTPVAAMLPVAIVVPELDAARIVAVTAALPELVT